LALLTAGLAAAEPAPATAQACGPELAQCDLQQDNACLRLTYACGRYETVAQTLFVEDVALTDDQKYFLGASFYGLYVRERSKGLECEMVTFGREYLSDYLTSVRSKPFGLAAGMDQIYHGTQMLNALNAVNGCVESALTRARIEQLSADEALTQSESIFLDPPDEAKSLFNRLLLALRSFVSQASDLETGIALRRVELQSARNHLDAIGAIFKGVFGTVSIEGANVALGTGTLDDLFAGAHAMLATVKAREADFKAALGGISAETYADLRSRNVANAQALLKASAFHVNMIGKVLPTDPGAPFWRLDAVLEGENASKASQDGLAAIRAAWRERGDRLGLCAHPQAPARLWYCR
jgi:hypothetical protein